MGRLADELRTQEGRLQRQLEALQQRAAEERARVAQRQVMAKKNITTRQERRARLTRAVQTERAALEHARVLVEVVEPVLHHITRIEADQANRAKVGGCRHAGRFVPYFQLTRRAGSASSFQVHGTAAAAAAAATAAGTACATRQQNVDEVLRLSAEHARLQHEVARYPALAESYKAQAAQAVAPGAAPAPAPVVLLDQIVEAHFAGFLASP